jgi:hypothetical protein
LSEGETLLTEKLSIQHMRSTLHGYFSQGRDDRSVVEIFVLEHASKTFREMGNAGSQSRRFVSKEFARFCHDCTPELYLQNFPETKPI